MLIAWSGIKIPISHYLSSCEWMVEDMVYGMDFLWASKVLFGTIVKDRSFTGMSNTGIASGGTAQESG